MAHPSEIHELQHEAHRAMRPGSIEESEALARIDHEREAQEREEERARRRASGHRGNGYQRRARWDD